MYLVQLDPPETKPQFTSTTLTLNQHNQQKEKENVAGLI